MAGAMDRAPCHKAVTMVLVAKMTSRTMATLPGALPGFRSSLRKMTCIFCTYGFRYDDSPATGRRVRSLRTFLRIFPVDVLGSSPTTTFLGTLNVAMAEIGRDHV